MTAMDRDLALSILKYCFPKVDNIRIIHNQIEDGQRHATSDVTRFIVEYDKDHITQRSHVAMKAPNSSSALFSLCDSYNVYNKEIGMYEEVIPRINKYLDESLAPAHLYTTDSKILVLEDLTARGYQSGEKRPLLNLFEAKGVMKAFAHFHAATHKLYQEDPSILENLLNSYFDGFDFRNVVIPWGSVSLELLRRKNETHLISKVEAAMSFFENDVDEIKAILEKSNFKFVALNHGDGRKDNFLFKNGANNQVKVQFVDYQGCFWSSPAFDLIYFLTNSVSADILEAHFDNLVDEYLHELSIRLKKLECASVYKRADFDEDLKALKFVLFLSFFCLCGLVSPLSMEQLIDTFFKPEPDVDYLYDFCLNDEQFVSIVYGWLKYFEKSKIANQF